MPDTTRDHERFSDQLPLYVNGTLEPDERAWMDAYLQANTKAQGELKLTELISATVNAYKSPVPEGERRARLLAAWKAGRNRPSLFQTLFHWARFPIPMPAAAMAVISMLVVGQLVVIVNRPVEGQTGAWRGEQSDCAAAPLVRVIFAPDAKQGEIVQLLRQANVVMRDGPSDTGEVWLAVAKGHAESDAVAVLRASALVNDVLPSAAMPAKADCR